MTVNLLFNIESPWVPNNSEQSHGKEPGAWVRQAKELVTKRRQTRCQQLENSSGSFGSDTEGHG